MRYSKQREIILNALKANPVHPTADYIYDLLKKNNPELSLGTVYRNLNLLAKIGKIKCLKGFDTKEHFDHNTFDHCHIKCSVCGIIEDIILPKALAKHLDNLKKETDFKINGCEILLRGKCKKCKTDKEIKNENKRN
ncbi:MAG: transcriptional repressor [Elusimicrobiota bacterium]|jgi:Fur family peroxide stress response transcriptional regulator|nr:transcriptional repressor [Elusimicrobiota bacterium]